MHEGPLDSASLSHACTCLGPARWRGWPDEWGAHTTRPAVCMPADTPISNLTVEGQLRYAADLACPRSLGAAVKAQRVEAALQAVRLTERRGAVIGDPTKPGIRGTDPITSACLFQVPCPTRPPWTSVAPGRSSTRVPRVRHHAIAPAPHRQARTHVRMYARPPAGK